MENELTFNGKGSITIVVFVYRVISAILWEYEFSHYITFECDVFSLVFGIAVLKGSSENPIVFNKYMPCISLGLSRGTNKEAQPAQRR